MGNLKKRLGLDIGSASIGWCLLECDDIKREYEIIDLGVRVWKNGKKEERRQHRSARTQKRYKKIRLDRLKKLLKSLPEFTKEKRGRYHPFRLRVDALEKKLSPKELRSVIFHIAKNRGFHPSTKESAKEQNDKTDYMKRMSSTEEAVKEHGGTYSQWLLDSSKNKPSREIFRAKRGRNFLPTVTLIKKEFQAIREEQEKYFAEIDWDELQKTLFFVREQYTAPLGRCSIYPGEERALKNDPSSLKFVMLQGLSNIKIKNKTEGSKRGLTTEEIQIASSICKEKDEIEIKELLKQMGLNEEYELDYDNLDMYKPVIHGLKHKSPGHQKLSKKAIDEVLNKFEKSGTPIAKILYEMGQTNTKTTKRLDYYAKSIGHIPNFYTVPPCRCTNLKNCLHNIAEEEREYGRNPNGVLHNAFNQLRKLVNTLIDRYGDIDEFSVELTHLKFTESQKTQMASRDKKRKKLNDQAKKLLDDNDIKINDNNKKKALLKKALLFFEVTKQNKGVPMCVYCGTKFDQEQIFRGDDVQIDHIIPQSKFRDDRIKNLVLACRECNQEKGERTPYDAFHSHSNPKYNYEQIKRRVPKTKLRRFSADALEKYKDKAERRALPDTFYASKHARNYLKSIAKSDAIHPTSGVMTATLRGYFELKKERESDLRHHALDAFIVALYHPKLRGQFNFSNQYYGEFTGKVSCNDKKLSEKIKEKLEKVIVSRRVHHSLQGALLKETAYGVYLNDQEEYEYRKSGLLSEAKKDLFKQIGKAENLSKKRAFIGVKAYEYTQYAYADLWVRSDESTKTKPKGCLIFTHLEKAVNRKIDTPWSLLEPEKGKWKKLYRLHKGDYIEDENKKIFRVSELDCSNERIALVDPNHPKPKGAPYEIRRNAPRLAQSYKPVHINILGHVKRGTSKN